MRIERIKYKDDNDNQIFYFAYAYDSCENISTESRNGVVQNPGTNAKKRKGSDLKKDPVTI